MPDAGYPLDAYLIIDNNAVVGLCDFYCDMYKELGFPEMVQAAIEEMAKTFASLRRFAIGGKIFTTNCVLDEFKPENSCIAERRDFEKQGCELFQSAIKKEIEALDINMAAIQKLRAMSQAPGKFGTHLSRLSDADLSLVILALGIINEKQCRVYILTDEEDLRNFISWAKSRPEVKAMCASSQLLEGLHSMIYIDSAHRQCAFTTNQVYDMFVHCQQRQLKRMVLAGTTKLEMIEITYRDIKESIRISGQMKIDNLAGVK